MPARKSARLLKRKTPRQLPLKIWSMLVSLYSPPNFRMWSPVSQVTVSAMPLRSVVETIGRKDDLAVGAQAGDLEVRQIEALVLARRVLDDVVDVQVVEHVVAPLRAVAGDPGFGVEALDAVVRLGAGGGVRGAVHARVVGEVAAQHQAMLLRRLPVEAAEEHVTVLAEGVGVRRGELGIAREDSGVEHPRVDRHRLALVHLVVGEEVEQLVGDDPAADRAAVLVLLLVGRLGAVGEVRDQALRLVVVEGRAVQAVGAALGDHVDEAAARASELDRGAVGDDRELLDRLLRDGERSAALGAAHRAAEEGVVEVHAVDGDVGVDAALAGDREVAALAVEARLRRQQDEVAEVARGERHLLDLLGENRRRVRGVGHLDHRNLRGHVDGLDDRRDLHREVDRRRRGENQANIRPAGGREALERRQDAVVAGGQIQQAIEPFAVGRGGRDESGFQVGRRDCDARKDRTILGRHRTGDARGGDIGLGPDRRGACRGHQARCENPLQPLHTVNLLETWKKAVDREPGVKLNYCQGEDSTERNNFKGDSAETFP